MWQVLTLKEIIDIYWVLAIWQTVFTYILFTDLLQDCFRINARVFGFTQEKAGNREDHGIRAGPGHRPTGPATLGVGKEFWKFKSNQSWRVSRGIAGTTLRDPIFKHKVKGEGRGHLGDRSLAQLKQVLGSVPRTPQINIYIITRNFYSQKGGSTLKLCVVFCICLLLLHFGDISSLVLSYLDTGQLRQGSYCDSFQSKNLGFSHRGACRVT